MCPALLPVALAYLLNFGFAEKEAPFLVRERWLFLGIPLFQVEKTLETF